MFFAARAMNGNKLAMTGENVLMVQKVAYFVIQLGFNFRNTYLYLILIS